MDRALIHLHSQLHLGLSLLLYPHRRSSLLRHLLWSPPHITPNARPQSGQNHMSSASSTSLPLTDPDHSPPLDITCQTTSSIDSSFESLDTRSSLSHDGEQGELVGHGPRPLLRDHSRLYCSLGVLCGLQRRIWAFRLPSLDLGRHWTLLILVRVELEHRGGRR
jgi:hypothetical protein